MEETETQGSEGFPQVCFKWCSDNSLCEKVVTQKICDFRDDGFLTETISIPPFVDVSIFEQQTVNIYMAHVHGNNRLFPGSISVRFSFQIVHKLICFGCMYSIQM